jgi:hypothetical protein
VKEVSNEGGGKEGGGGERRGFVPDYMSIWREARGKIFRERKEGGEHI